MYLRKILLKCILPLERFWYFFIFFFLASILSIYDVFKFWMQALTAVCVCKGYELRKFNSYNAAASLVLRLMSGLSRNWQENIPVNKMRLICDYTHVTPNGMYHSILLWLLCAFFAGIEGRTIGILLSGLTAISANQGWRL
jgi:hypothetical protein